MPPAAQSPRRSNYSRYAQPMQAVAPKPAPLALRPAAKPPAALKIIGPADLWQTLQKVTDLATGWTKTTRAMIVPGGVLINTCSRKTGAPIAAEALVMVPDADLARDVNGHWRIV